MSADVEEMDTDELLDEAHDGNAQAVGELWLREGKALRAELDAARRDLATARSALRDALVVAEAALSEPVKHPQQGYARVAVVEALRALAALTPATGEPTT